MGPNDHTHVELTLPGKQPISLRVGNLDELRSAAAAELGREDFHVLGSDGEELASLDGRRAVQAVAHPCKKAIVSVSMDRTISENFPVSQTVRRVIEWAVGKKGFNLDHNQAAKANLVLPNTDTPLPKETLIGQFVSVQDCSASFVLTMKDFTNG